MEETCILINASPADVWEVLADIRNWPTWAPTVTSVTTTATDLVVGTTAELEHRRFRLRSGPSPRWNRSGLHLEQPTERSRHDRRTRASSKGFRDRGRVADHSYGCDGLPGAIVWRSDDTQLPQARGGRVEGPGGAGPIAEVVARPSQMTCLIRQSDKGASNEAIDGVGEQAGAAKHAEEQGDREITRDGCHDHADPRRSGPPLASRASDDPSEQSAILAASNPASVKSMSPSLAAWAGSSARTTSRVMLATLRGRGAWDRLAVDAPMDWQVRIGSGSRQLKMR